MPPKKKQQADSGTKGKEADKQEGEQPSQEEQPVQQELRTGRGTFRFIDGAMYGRLSDFIMLITSALRYTYFSSSVLVVSWWEWNDAEGEWIEQDGVKCRHGKGTFTHPSGERYEGDWEWDRMSGKGTFTSVTGAQYNVRFLSSETCIIDARLCGPEHCSIAFHRGLLRTVHILERGNTCGQMEPVIVALGYRTGMIINLESLSNTIVSVVYPFLSSECMVKAPSSHLKVLHGLENFSTENTITEKHT